MVTNLVLWRCLVQVKVSMALGAGADGVGVDGGGVWCALEVDGADVRCNGAWCRC